MHGEDKMAIGKEKLAKWMLSQHINAEQVLLGLILDDKKARKKIIKAVSPDNLYSDNYKKIFKTVLGLLMKNQSYDLKSLTNELKDQGNLESVRGMVHLSELIKIAPHLQRSTLSNVSEL